MRPERTEPLTWDEIGKWDTPPDYPPPPHKATKKLAPSAGARATGYAGNPFDRLLARASPEAATVGSRDKEIGGSGSAHLNPLGLFLRTFISFIWRKF